MLLLVWQRCCAPELEVQKSYSASHLTVQQVGTMIAVFSKIWRMSQDLPSNSKYLLVYLSAEERNGVSFFLNGRRKRTLAVDYTIAISNHIIYGWTLALQWLNPVVSDFGLTMSCF
jgi:hypothetical protein